MKSPICKPFKDLEKKHSVITKSLFPSNSVARGQIYSDSKQKEMIKQWILKRKVIVKSITIISKKNQLPLPQGTSLLYVHIR